MSDLSVIILTFNEEKHLERCIRSLLSVTDKIFVVDSFSTDNTIEIAKKLGAQVYQNAYVNHAIQFQWGLDHCDIKTSWVMKLDADEYLLPSLQTEINEKLPSISENISGIYIKRRVVFQDRWIRFGDYYPIWLLRIWRFSDGHIEQRWMDEHIKLTHGKTVNFHEDLVDHNLNNLTWWTTKHNHYATREAIDILNILHKFLKYDEIEVNFFGTQEQRKRWLKKRYAKLPLFTRPFIYFIWRYFIKFGFLDGKQGLIWHFLQGFWYRFLVDAKIYEIQKKSKESGESVQKILHEEHNIKFGD